MEKTKDIVDEIYSKYTITVDKGGCHEYYSCLIFRALLLIQKSTFNVIIKFTKYGWDNGTEIESGDLNQNATKKYNKMVAAKVCTKIGLVTYP